MYCKAHRKSQIRMIEWHLNYSSFKLLFWFREGDQLTLSPFFPSIYTADISCIVMTVLAISTAHLATLTTSAQASHSSSMSIPTSTLKFDQAISTAKHVDCERQCPYYYFPICATNGNPSENRMFVNICEMHAWNCDVEKSKLNSVNPLYFVSWTSIKKKKMVDYSKTIKFIHHVGLRNVKHMRSLWKF